MGSGIRTKIGAAVVELEAQIEAEFERLKKEAEADESLLYDVALEYDRRGDIEAAKDYYERASRAGSVLADHNLACIYDNLGQYIEAKKWYDRGVKKGDYSALTNLAFLFEHGQGVERDIEHAKALYARAAPHDLQAKNNLATLLIDGTSEEEQRARQLFLEAAEQGHAQAMFNLAELLLDTDTSRPDGLDWMRRAARNGYPKASAWLVENDPGFISEWEWKPKVSFGPMVFGESVETWITSLGLVQDEGDPEIFESIFYGLFVQTTGDRFVSVMTYTNAMYDGTNLVGLDAIEAIEAIGEEGWVIDPVEPELEWFTIRRPDLGIDLSFKNDRVWSVSVELEAGHPLWDV